ncbi:MAG: hypothetical protein L7F77_04670 [Candidatus Magnetominusculus sp. LBB02]|nr:hypothetical protein [Candidatus Magnetominusculus sp. LBB02]
MMINLMSRLAVLLAVLALMIFTAADVSVAAKCEDTYYYALFGDSHYFATRRLRAFEISVSFAYIYDLPNFPSSWEYIYDNNDGDITTVTAAAKSDDDAISYKDLEKFAILRQPKDMSGYKIMIQFIAIYIDKEGISRTHASVLDSLSIHTSPFDVKKIDKCFPKKPRRH